VRWAGGRDVKIEADRRLHELICRRLESASPWPRWSEEGPPAQGWRNGGHLWVVDPLDGSLNFSRGIPMSCVSIALWDGARPVLGVVLDVGRGELFTGQVGRGAWLNGRRIRPSRVRRPAEALVCTGFPVGADFRLRTLSRFVAKVRRFKKVRALGSAALSLAYVAAGRADLYHEERIAWWDVAAGLALVQAAGGRIVWQPMGEGPWADVRAGNRWIMAATASRG
jgi:myo-inositol-1(or 4)-monophosphatase